MDSLERKQFALEAVANELSSHFGTIQIVATGEVEDGTAVFTAGFGNIFAREGSIREWLRKQEIVSTLNIRRDIE